MKHDRLARINERVREELSAALYRVAPGEGADVGRVSIVAARVSPDLHNAIISVSILGDEGESHALMSWLRSHRADFQRYLADKVALKYTPVLDFRRTDAIATGARVLGILDELAAEKSPEAEAADTPETEP